MNHIEEELSYIEKEQVDRAETLRQGKGLLSIWLLHQIRTFRKLGLNPEVILQAIEFECRKLL